jgi:hypothetical protein
VGDDLFPGYVSGAGVEHRSEETGRLFQPVHSTGERIEAHAKGIELLPIPTGAYACHDTVASKQRSQLKELPERQRRMLEAEVDDAGAENQAL